jgi:LuxR family maltose regulon positive regulatory protein
VLVFVQKGLSNKEICQQLSISLSTVKWHIKNIFGKLQISNRAAAISYYHMKGNLKSS